MTSNITRKIGTPYLHDPRTGLNIQLPRPFQIIHRHDFAWNGGSVDGRQYLHIERVPTDSSTIPTILADGDLDMYIVSTGRAENIAPLTKGMEVAGQIGGQNVKGYLAMVCFNETHSYLVFVAAPEKAYTVSVPSFAQEITRLIRTAAKQG